MEPGVRLQLFQLSSWVELARRPAPAWTALPAAAAGYLGAAFYPVFMVRDMKHLSGLGPRAVLCFFDDTGGGVTNPLGYILAPVVMILVYLKARSLQRGGTAARYVDVAGMLCYAALGCVIYASKATGSQTGLHDLLGLAVLFLAGRRDGSGGWRIDLS